MRKITHKGLGSAEPCNMHEERMQPGRNLGTRGFNITFVMDRPYKSRQNQPTGRLSNFSEFRDFPDDGIFGMLRAVHCELGSGMVCNRYALHRDYLGRISRLKIQDSATSGPCSGS